ncbi:MAG: DUF2339 domain-containing protein [Chitinophaga sp.]|jgi:uncharacterized membrane protein|nr:DUF2339 domain-containing protein [Chitinophaga sp.]
MNNITQQIIELEKKLDSLRLKQRLLEDNFYAIQSEIKLLKNKALKSEDSISDITEKLVKADSTNQLDKINEVQQFQPLQKPIQSPKKVNNNSKQLEDFIGTNLISKIGILVTVIGVFIGAKYAIDKDLISPALRIILGYLMALGLIVVALRLKTKYENFSAVLLSGGVTILYFISFIAFSFYALFSREVAFGIMLITTAFAVVMAIKYNQKIIALLGQVGAYAIPFLLSDGSGKIAILFTYMAIINIGILILAFQKDWKLVYRVAFCTSWLIYLITCLFSNTQETYFTIKIIFLSIHFITFYITFLAYKIIKKELYNLLEIGTLLMNSIIYFSVSFSLFTDHYSSNTALTVFTLFNAAVHLAAGFSIFKMKLADNTVYLFLLSLGIAFVTIAVPVTFKENWITILWIIEATALCFIGFKAKRSLYLNLGILLIALACFSLFIDWNTHYGFVWINNFSVKSVRAFANFNFLSTLLFCSCLAYISLIGNRNSETKPYISEFFSLITPLIFLGILYLGVYFEICLLWHDLHANYNNFIRTDNFKSISLILYSALFVLIGLILNVHRFKNKLASGLFIGGALLVTVYSLTEGLRVIGDLRQDYLSKHEGNIIWMLGIRYFVFAAIACLLIYVKKGKDIFIHSKDVSKIFSSLFNITLLTIICNEFIHWMDIDGYKNQYKLGLSIIAGLYALTLISVGIFKRQKHLRINAIILLAATLVKLFFYDLASLSAISKTIVLIILGVILLIASFLYNKFKHVLFEDVKE